MEFFILVDPWDELFEDHYGYHAMVLMLAKQLRRIFLISCRKKNKQQISNHFQRNTQDHHLTPERILDCKQRNRRYPCGIHSERKTKHPSK